jgi:hypothetical protein
MMLAVFSIPRMKVGGMKARPGPGSHGQHEAMVTAIAPLAHARHA